MLKPYLRPRKRQSKIHIYLAVAIVALFGLTLAFVLLTVGATASAAIGGYLYFTKDLASPETLTNRQIALTTRIYDRKGRLLNEVFAEEKRTYVPLSKISPYLISATIATEDADFYRNPGINIRGVARAMVQTLRGEGEVQGGSSITQQLVKNVLIPPEERAQRSFSRKIKEFILAYEVTNRYSKEKILELYLNEIYYGNLSYGIEAAAESYFGKSAKDLTLAESAMLAGLPQAPAVHSPLVDPQKAKRRQSDVLDLIVRQGYITEEQAEAAKKEKLEYKQQHFPIKAPHFVMYVRGLLEKKYGADALYKGGLRVTTTLDLDLQEQAETFANEQIEKIKETNNARNAAVVTIRPQTGEILAMVGSVDFFDPSIDGQVNMTIAERQPGSAFKPFNYVTAFAKGFTPATMLLDIRGSFDDGVNPPYVPEDVDGKVRGPISVRQALAWSLNIPAVRTLKLAGIQNVIDTAHKMGITTLTREHTYGLSLTLGGGEVKPLDMVYAYSVFANGGEMRGVPTLEKDRRPGMRELDPVAILKVEDDHGKVLEDFKTPQVRQVISPQLAYLITHILSDNEARAGFFGQNNPLTLPDRPAAAKTGTTDDWRDVWTIGYTPDLATGVWVGNSDNEPMFKILGIASAAPIWQRFMQFALKGKPPSNFAVPDGLVEATVCETSGLLPTPQCPKTRREIFIQGTVPKEVDNIYQVFKIDKTTGKLATSYTPPQNIEERVYMVLPLEAADWVRANDIPQPPTEYSPATASELAISYPQAGSYIKGLVSIRGNARGNNFMKYGLQYGQGLSPSQWTQIGTLHDKPVTDGVLEAFDTRQLEGLHSLRLSVIDGNQGIKNVTIPITVDNSSPTVKVVYPYANSVLELDPLRFVSVGIQAEAKDNVGIDRVEFFVDDQSIGFTTVFPYNQQWKLSLGTHKIHAVAYDKAGNTTTSQPITVRVVEAKKR